MDFTFGIITSGNPSLIKVIVDSIRDQKIPNYEIIIVGGEACISGSDVQHVAFDEKIKAGWITRKKNIICEFARYENIVLLHDYIKFLPGWYDGFLKFGSDYEFCINPIKTTHNARYRDFCIFPYGIEPYFQKACLLPYDFDPRDTIRKILYISGAYYVIKKLTALKFPLDERLFHGAGEDVYYSRVLSQNNIFIKCNPHSAVQLIKHKDQIHWERKMNCNDLTYLESLPDKLLDGLSQRQMDHVIGHAKSCGVDLRS